MLEQLQASLLEAVIALVSLVIVPFLISLIRKAGQLLVEKLGNEHLASIEGRIEDKFIKYVTITNQTYVDSLKASGSFDAEAQKVAFKKTYDAIMANISLDQAEFISQTYGDLEKYVSDMIEYWARNLKS